MITLNEWSTSLRAASSRIDVELTELVAATARYGAVKARGYIGDLQSALTVGPPVPVVMPAWDPLAPSTMIDKAALGLGDGDGRPLFRTGEMEASVEGVSAGLTGAVVSDDKVAFYQEVGTSKIPPRPFLSRAVADIVPDLALGMGRIGIGALIPKVK